MNDGRSVALSDPVVRRVAGAILLVAAVGVLLVFTLATGGGSLSWPAEILTAALAGGLGAAGLRLLVRPAGRRSR